MSNLKEEAYRNLLDLVERDLELYCEIFKIGKKELRKHGRRVVQGSTYTWYYKSIPITRADFSL